LFVPRDSYEFVHTQFAQFQNQVNQAIPGQSPDALPVQSSETVQQVLAQLQRRTAEPSANSFMNALLQWWRGAEEETSGTETLALTSPAAETFTPPPLQLSPSPPIQPANTFVSTPQPAPPRSAGVQEYFARQTAPSHTPVQQLAVQQLATLPPVPEIPSQQPQPSFLSPLTTLAPLSESVPTLSEPNTPLMTTLPTSPPVSSDLLLRNAGQATNPNASAQVFRLP